MSERDWTTISVTRSIQGALKDFCEGYGVSGKSEGIGLLLRIADEIGIDVNENGEVDVDGAHGFVIDGDSFPDKEFVSLYGSNITIITDQPESSQQAAPFERCTLQEAEVYCPGCGSVVFSYELSPLLPSVNGGLFTDFEIECTECEKTRPAYALFSTIPNVEGTLSEGVDLDQYFRVLVPYWGYTLAMGGFNDVQFVDRYRVCSDVSDDAGWDWPPTPEKLVGYTTNEERRREIEVTDYLRFLSKVVKAESEELDDVVVEAGPVELTVCCNRTEHHLHFEVNESGVTALIKFLEGLTELWDGITATVEKEDPQYADAGVVMMFDGFD